MNISLTEEDFKALVSGQIVKRESEVRVPSPGWGSKATRQKVEVQISLQDIGFGKMAQIVTASQKETT